jgi:hypothetical protein
LRIGITGKFGRYAAGACWATLHQQIKIRPDAPITGINEILLCIFPRLTTFETVPVSTTHGLAITWPVTLILVSAQVIKG